MGVWILWERQRYYRQFVSSVHLMQLGALLAHDANFLGGALARNGALLDERPMRLDLAATMREHEGARTCVFVRNLPHDEWSMAKVRSVFD